MTLFDLGPALLFVPADRPDRYAKAYDRSDAIIIDLEDAVAPADKTAARTALAQHLATMTAAQAAVTVIRVNPVNDPAFIDDVALVRGSSARFVMLPKVESLRDLDRAAAELPNVAFLTLCETAAGVMAAAAIAQHPAVVALMWGAEDLMVSTGGTASRHANGVYRDVPRFARAQVLLAAAAAGKGSIDTIHTALSPTDQFIAESQDAVASGFTAKACIHPAQVPVVQAAYRPGEEAVEYARALLAAVAQHQGAFQFRGTMVDGPLIAHAKTVVSRAKKLQSPQP